MAFLKYVYFDSCSLNDHLVNASWPNGSFIQMMKSPAFASPCKGILRSSGYPKNAKRINIEQLGRGGGQVVSVLAFYSDDPSSNPADAYIFL